MNSTRMKVKPILVLLYLLWNHFSTVVVCPFIISHLFETENVAADLFAELVSVSLPVCVFLVISYPDNKKFFVFMCDDKKSKSYIFPVVSLLLLFLIIYYVENCIECFMVLNNYIDVSAKSNNNNYSIITVITAIIAYVVLPAISEELFYRGIIYDSFPLVGDKYIIFYSAVIFAVAHSTLYSIINAFILGLFLMYTYIETKSIKMCIILHFIHNSLCCFFANVIELPYSISGIIKNFGETELIKRAGCISVSISAVCLVSLLVFCKYYRMHINKKCSAYNSLKEQDMSEKISRIAILADALLYRAIRFII